MTKTDYTAFTKLARKLVAEAMTEIMDSFQNKVKVDRKEDFSEVTSVDKDIEQTWIDTIRDQYPSHHIHGEELGLHSPKTDSDRPCWYLDPVDGTTNYVFGNPIFGSMIAVVHKKNVVASAVGYPLLDKTYWATIDTGAYCNNTLLTLPKTSTPFNKTTILMEFKKEAYAKNKKLISQLIAQSRSFRRYGSMVGMLPVLESGKLELCLLLDSNIYDSAPVALILQETGFITITKNGEPWSPQDKNSLIALNPNKKEFVQNLL